MREGEEGRGEMNEMDEDLCWIWLLENRIDEGVGIGIRI